MSLFNFLDEQSEKEENDTSFMGMGSIWEEMGKPVVDSVFQNDAQMTDENWASQHTEFVNHLVENQEESMWKNVGGEIVDQTKLSLLGLERAYIESGAKGVFENMPQPGTLGLLHLTGLNNQDIKAKVNSLIGKEDISDEERLAQISTITEELYANISENQPDWSLISAPLTKQGVRAAVTSAPLMAVSMLASFATSNPWTGLSLMGLSTAGSSYGSARTEDMPVSDSLRYAAVDGTIEALTERISIVPLMNMFKKGGKESVQNAKKYVVNELIGENVAEFTQEMNAWYHGLSELWQNENLSTAEKIEVQAQQQWIASVAALTLSGSTTATSQLLQNVDLDLNNLQPSAIPGSPNNLLRMFAEPRFGMMAGEIAAQRLGKNDDLAKAKQLDSEGVDAKKIWKETGFAKGQDGNWRFEIDDSQATLKPLDVVMDANLAVKGSGVLDHDEVMKAYPELENIDVYPYKFNLDPSTHGYYADKGGIPEIGLNPVSRKTVEEYSLDKEGKANLKKGKTLHEFQHAIQKIEGHEGGTSPAMEAGKVFIEENLPDLRAQITNIDLQLNALGSSGKGSDLAQIYPLLNRKTELEKELVKQDQYIQDKGYENYKKTLGELEAFQTQDDVALTAEERASRLPAYLLDDEARTADSALSLGDQFTESDEEAVGIDDGLLSDIKPNTLMKSSDFKRRKDGTYIGFSKSINTPQKLNKLITQIDRMATEGADARMWYEDSSNQILNLVNGDKVEAEKLAQIIAITSQGASVETNTGFAFKAYMQHKAGMPIEAGRFPAAQSKKIVDVLNGIPWEGRKTNSFYENLMIEIDPTKVTQNTTTQDMWMARAFGLDSEVPGSGQYEVMEKITQSIATKNGWRPHQAQAAVWVAVKARNDAMKSVINAEVKKKGWGNNANDIFPEHQKKFDKFYQTTVYDSEYNLDEFLKASYSFADGIEDNLGYINLEAVPGTTTSFLQGINNAKPEEVAAYTKDMYSIFLDENGVDLLAKEIGIVSPGNFLGFGGWKGDINPNVQVQGILSGTQASGINAADIALVETYAAVVGTIFKQDGVSYRRAFADKKVGNQNAVDIDIGRQLTKEENERLYAELTKQFGNDYVSPTSNSSGADIINYTPFDDSVPTVTNADFKMMVKQAIIDADLGEVELGYYRSEGNLLTNDWKENPNGESYKNRENLTGNAQEIYERMVDKFGKEADKINARYAEEYGW